MRRGVLAAGAVVVAVAGGGVAVMAAGSGEKPVPKKQIATAEIVRGDLIDTESVDGTLTYAGERQIGSGANGTVTWAPAAVRVISRGESLFKVDGKPVTLMYGPLPVYRTLRNGVEGKDVEQLERNLRKLGYGADMTVDEDFTAATAQAVKDWQEDRGLAETGTVDAGQIVFQPASIRVKEVKAGVGGRVSAGGAALTVTGVDRRVHVDLDADKQDLAPPGDRVTIELPGGKTVHGKITKVGKVATKHDDTTTVDVEISLGGAGTGSLDQAPVTVSLESEHKKNVLSVPVEALLGLASGGFGLEIVENGTSRLVGVTAGSFGGGRVEVTGDGLAAGMKVGVPES
jgi:peptidoglycan hydrolase-like protein with peptidoglycan-binding domain